MKPAEDYVRMNVPGLTPRGLLRDAPALRTVAEVRGDTRSPKDYAIEFGGYLATAAAAYMDFIGRTQTVVDPGDEYADHQRALNSAIYEFRKRAERAK